MTLQTERVRTLDQVRAFVEGSEAVDPRFHGDRFSRRRTRGPVYEFVRRALVRLDYGRLVLCHRKAAGLQALSDTRRPAEESGLDGGSLTVGSCA